MKLYLLLEKANTGKSTTIRKVFTEIVDKRGGQLIWKKSNRSKEIIALVRYADKNIGFICKGDTPDTIKDEWKILLENVDQINKIDVLICACRNEDSNSIENLYTILECLKNNKKVFNRDKKDKITIISLDNNKFYKNGKIKYDLDNDYITIVNMCTN